MQVSQTGGPLGLYERYRMIQGLALLIGGGAPGTQSTDQQCSTIEDSTGAVLRNSHLNAAWP